LKLQRASGLLLHPTCLPGRYGIGALGAQARDFAGLLAASGQTVWQMLPLGPTGYGDSPYQGLSTFAGNPLLIDLDDLVADGWLLASDLAAAPVFSEDAVDYGAVIDFKRPLLERACERFEQQAADGPRQALQEFCRRQAFWLDDFALFTALKAEHDGAAWSAWEPAVARREAGALETWRRRCVRRIARCKFQQFVFFQQWRRLQDVCAGLGVRLMGDLPLFVAHDSADVWAHPELFRLTADGRPAFQAGVPPDYFSATGQCWGNPLYRWDMMARTGFAWWIERFRHTLEWFDLVRLDHFRGFEACWEIPGDDQTAENGRWIQVPGPALFEALRAALPALPCVAENLGVITPEVEQLRRELGFPGMAVLQFAFGADPPVPEFLPHNYSHKLVVYTGTHDNDTTVGWWHAGPEDGSTRSAAAIDAERAYCRRYLGSDGREIHWAFIRAALASVAALAVVPLQDVLGLGSEARMNLPARPADNWRWRFRRGAFSDELRARLRELSEVYGRFTPPAG